MSSFGRELHTGRAAVPIPKRSEALRERHLKMFTIRRAREIEPASQSTPRPPPAWHRARRGQDQAASRWPLKKRPVLTPPARAALLSLGRDEKRPFQPNKKLPKREGRDFPLTFPRLSRDVAKIAVGAGESHDLFCGDHIEQEVVVPTSGVTFLPHTLLAFR